VTDGGACGCLIFAVLVFCAWILAMAILALLGTEIRI
jgi:hypothetical protein